MTSKEALESIRNEYYTENGRKIVVIGNDDERFDIVEKDLEELEEIKKIMGTPIQDIMKQLKVLDQLKEILSMDYLVRVYGYEMAKRLQTYLKSNDIVKNWLEK